MKWGRNWPMLGPVNISSPQTHFFFIFHHGPLMLVSLERSCKNTLKTLYRFRMRPVVVKLWAKPLTFVSAAGCRACFAGTKSFAFGAQIFITDPTYIKLVFSESLSHGKTAPIYRI